MSGTYINFHESKVLGDVAGKKFMYFIIRTNGGNLFKFKTIYSRNLFNIPYDFS
jgi:hypothetical protein